MAAFLCPQGEYLQHKLCPSLLNCGGGRITPSVLLRENGEEKCLYNSFHILTYSAESLQAQADQKHMMQVCSDN